MTAADLVTLLSVALLLVMSAAIGMRLTFEEVAQSVRRIPLMAKGTDREFRSDADRHAGTRLCIRSAAAACGRVPDHVGLSGGEHGTAAHDARERGPSLGDQHDGAVRGAVAAARPALLVLLLSKVASASALRIDYGTIILTLLLTQIIPMALALAFHRWQPGIARKLVVPLTVLFNLLLVAMMVASVYAQWQDLVRFRYVFWIGMLLLIAATLLIGWVLGGPDVATRKSVALTTVGRNSAVALVIASTNFGDSLAVAAIVIYVLVQTIAGLAIAPALRNV